MGVPHSKKLNDSGGIDWLDLIYFNSCKQVTKPKTHTENNPLYISTQ